MLNDFCDACEAHLYAFINRPQNVVAWGNDKSPVRLSKVHFDMPCPIKVAPPLANRGYAMPGSFEEIAFWETMKRKQVNL